jgi:metal-dependent amidase/aminoacylase/carboxypeptidase family protein
LNLKKRAEEAIGAARNDLVEISHWMYHHPETAYEEFESSARLVEFLRANGFDVEYPAYGLDTAFAARVGTSGPHVVICAEEHYGGKVDLIEAGAFEGVAAAMMVHPSTDDVVDPKVIAVAHIDVHFYGKEAHASAHPQLGINALDAFVQAYVNISTLRQAIFPTDKIHGVIREGGHAPNIIPAYTRSSWYVRAETKDRLDDLFPRVQACFEAAALATGCRVEIEHVGHTYTEMVSDQTLVEYYAANSAEIGRPMRRGRDLPPDQTGSTDMGNVSLIVPTIHPMIDIASTPHVNHQPEFAAHTITPDGDKAIVDGAVSMAWTVIDMAEQDAWSRLGVGVG